MDTKLQVLRAKIRGFQVAGEGIRHRIKKTTGLKRQFLWQQKRALGVHGRYHLIAYGLLRGITYEKIERCDANNRPDPAVVFELMKAHVTWQQERVMGKLVDTVTLEGVRLLLGLTRPQQPPAATKTLLDRARSVLENIGAR